MAAGGDRAASAQPFHGDPNEGTSCARLIVEAAAAAEAVPCRETACRWWVGALRGRCGDDACSDGAEALPWRWGRPALADRRVTAAAVRDGACCICRRDAPAAAPDAGEAVVEDGAPG